MNDDDCKRYPFIPLPDWRERPLAEMRERLAEFYSDLNRRRTVREFSDRPVPRDLIEIALKAAGTAPSGANLQPWHFSVVGSATIKQRIRVAAEAEEREFYTHRASPTWLAATVRRLSHHANQAPFVMNHPGQESALSRYSAVPGRCR